MFVNHLMYLLTLFVDLVGGMGIGDAKFDGTLKFCILSSFMNSVCMWLRYFAMII